MNSPIILANGAGGLGMATAARVLLEGRSALDAVEQGIREIEVDASIRTVGLGGAPNLLGQMECDASIMCGKTLRCGAVGALRDYVHAITVARQVMERTPHTMLVGEGAALFAGEIGEQPTNMLTARAREDYQEWLSAHVSDEVLLRWPHVPLSPYAWESANPKTAKGTTCFLVRSSDANLAGGVSSSGWAYKYPGRLGDSPVIGAGMFVDNRWGACACTHSGEMAIRSGTARAVIAYLKKGATVREAVQEAMDDLSYLEGGYQGPLVIHAMDGDGSPYVAYTGGIEPPIFWLWRADIAEVQCFKADFFDVKRSESSQTSFPHMPSDDPRDNQICG